MPMEVEVKSQQTLCQFCPERAEFVLTFGTMDHNKVHLALCKQCLTDLAWHLDKEVMDMDYLETTRCDRCGNEEMLCECPPF